MKKLFQFLASLCLVVSLFALPVHGAENGTITIENPQKGVTYNAYKIFDATYSSEGGTTGVNYSTNAATKDFFQSLTGNPFEFSKGNGDNYYVTYRTGVPMERVTEFFNYYRDQIDNYFASSKLTASMENNQVVFTNVPSGYYYVTTSNGSTISLGTAHPNAVIQDKTQKPSTNEHAKQVYLNGSWVVGGSVEVNQSYPFKVEFSASNYDGDTLISQYVLTDTPKNIDIDVSSLVLTIGTKEIPYADFAANNISASQDAASGVFTVTIPWAEENTPLYRPSPTDVKLTYNGTVTQGAAGQGATNEIVIDYGTGNVMSSIVSLSTDYFTLNKYKEGKTQIISGASFTLWDAKEGGNRINVDEVTNDEGETLYVVAGRNLAGNNTMIKAGSTQVRGLAAGTYYLEEVEAPAGYNKLNERVEVVVNGSSGQNLVEVVNLKGTILPGTGKNEKNMVYLMAAVLFAAGVLLIVFRKKIIKGLNH